MESPSTSGATTPHDATVPGPRQRSTAESLSEVALTATVVAGLLDASPDGMLLANAEGRLLLVNTQIEALFGYSRGELLNQPIEMLIPEQQRAIHRGHRPSYGAQPRLRPMGMGLPLTGRRQDGSEFPVEISLSPLSTGDGQWTVATVRDATERQSAERQRREHALMEEQLRIARSLGDTVVHALFGTGLQLQGLLELADERTRQGLDRAIESIDLSIRRLRDAIFDLSTPPPADPPA